MFMAKKEFFGNRIEPKCHYCYYGNLTRSGDKVLCEKVGVVDFNSKPCKKYIYDPLKRIPVKQLKKGVIAEDNI